MQLPLPRLSTNAVLLGVRSIISISSGLEPSQAIFVALLTLLLLVMNIYFDDRDVASKRMMDFVVVGK